MYVAAAMTTNNITRSIATCMPRGESIRCYIHAEVCSINEIKHFSSDIDTPIIYMPAAPCDGEAIVLHHAIIIIIIIII